MNENSYLRILFFTMLKKCELHITHVFPRKSETKIVFFENDNHLRQ